MYERFTDRARMVMRLANQEAQRLNHEYVDTHHLLIGLVKEGAGVAANVLKNLDVDLRSIRVAIEQHLQAGPDMVTMGNLPQTPRAKKVIEDAIKEARDLNHNYVGTEHLLIALAGQHEGVAAAVLASKVRTRDGGSIADAIRKEAVWLLAERKSSRLDATTLPPGELRQLPVSQFVPAMVRIGWTWLRACDVTGVRVEGNAVIVNKGELFACREKFADEATARGEAEKFAAALGPTVIRAWHVDLTLPPGHGKASP